MLLIDVNDWPKASDLFEAAHLTVHDENRLRSWFTNLEDFRHAMYPTGQICKPGHRWCMEPVDFSTLPGYPKL